MSYLRTWIIAQPDNPGLLKTSYEEKCSIILVIRKGRKNNVIKATAQTNTHLSVIILCSLCSLVVSRDVNAELLERQYISTPRTASVSPVITRNDIVAVNLPYSECRIVCRSRSPKEFCASDGNTYLSKCDFRKAVKCLHRDITVVGKGRCAGLAQPDLTQLPMSACPEVRQKLQATHGANDKIHIPECYRNGSYKEVQCLSDWCWCVTEQGEPVPGTSRKDITPNCSLHIGFRITTKIRRGASKRKCSREQRGEFNSNMVRAFSQDFHRTVQDLDKISPRTEDDIEQTIIKWKFQSIDKNLNGQLSRRELREFRKIVRKHIEPKRCSKRFHKYCDQDNDMEISEHEWMLCFGQNNAIQRGDRQDTGPGLSEQGGSLAKTTTDQRLLVGRQTKSNQSEIHNCHTERARAQEQERTNPLGQVFVPECTDTGLFKKTQCHHYTGYCWCVHEFNGDTIPGYAKKDKLPECEHAQPIRQIKGCSLNHKIEFVTLAMDNLTRELSAVANRHPTSELIKNISKDQTHSLEERSARYKFAKLDTNNNGKLERNESRPFKEFVKTIVAGKNQKKLRKCARRFVRFCDADENGKILLDEWINCLTPPKVDPNQPTFISRPGQNPLDQYLSDGKSP